MGNNCFGLKEKQVDRKSRIYLKQMSVFQTESVLTMESRRKDDKIRRQRQNVAKEFSNATKALRQTYKATQTVLGEGAFGAVFLFKSRDDLI